MMLFMGSNGGYIGKEGFLWGCIPIPHYIELGLGNQLELQDVV